MPRTSWERIAATSGILFVVVLVASFFTPETPDADDPTAEIVETVADDRSGLLTGAYLGSLAALLFLIFTAGLWTSLRRREPEPGPSVLVLLGGLGSSLIVLIANAATVALVYAADEGREPEAVRALFELDESLFLGVAMTSAAFYGGVALSALATRSLPAWLAWLAAALAIAFPVALLGIFSEDEEGGVLGGIFFAAFLVNVVWILAASIVLLTRREAAPRDLAPAAGGGPTAQRPPS